MKPEVIEFYMFTLKILIFIGSKGEYGATGLTFLLRAEKVPSRDDAPTTNANGSNQVSRAVWRLITRILQYTSSIRTSSPCSVFGPSLHGMDRKMQYTAHQRTPYITLKWLVVWTQLALVLRSRDVRILQGLCCPRHGCLLIIQPFPEVVITPRCFFALVKVSSRPRRRRGKSWPHSLSQPRHGPQPFKYLPYSQLQLRWWW